MTYSLLHSLVESKIVYVAVDMVSAVMIAINDLLADVQQKTPKRICTVYPKGLWNWAPSTSE